MKYPYGSIEVVWEAFVKVKAGKYQFPLAIASRDRVPYSVAGDILKFKMRLRSQTSLRSL